MISIAGVIYGYATDCNFKIETNTEEISTNRYKLGTSAGEWKEYESVSNGWSGDTAHLMSTDGADFNALFTALSAGTAVAVVFEPVTNGTTETTPGTTGEIVEGKEGYTYSGTAFITELSAGAPVDGQATYSVSLQGTGALTSAKVTAS